MRGPRISMISMGVVGSLAGFVIGYFISGNSS